MSCSVIIRNNDMSSRTIFTILIEDGQPAGKGKVVSSNNLPGGNSSVSNVSQPLAIIGISAKQYQENEVVDLGTLINSTAVDCRRTNQVVVNWANNRFDVRYQ